MDGIVLRSKTGISQSLSLRISQRSSGTVSFFQATPIPVQFRRDVVKPEAKQDASSRIDNSGWVGGLPVSALLLRLLILGTLLIPGMS
jgi:hypothetical protein